MKSVKSYAKINLSLNILSKKEDGYHELDMIMVPVELHDSIVFTSRDKAINDNFITVDDFATGLIHYNLASSAINALTAKYNKNDHFRVYIHKNIPMQAGLGGGSSNAAFAMKAVNNILKINASDEELIDIATPLGADIPFFIKCEPARCQGIGEKIKSINIKNNYYVLIVKPEAGCSTKEVFKKYDIVGGKEANIEDVIRALEDGNDELLAKSMSNVLEDAAIEIVPEIKEIKQYLYDAGLKIVMMSGSGSSVYGLSTDKSLLKKISKSIGDRWFNKLTKIIK